MAEESTIRRKTDVKQLLFEILEVAPEGDKASRIFDIFIITLISLNVTAVVFETVESLSSQYALFFRFFELSSVLIFTVEYILRIWTCTANDMFRKPVTGRIRFMSTPMAIVDLLAILPFYLPMLIPLDLRIVRSLRLLRLFRILKVGRYSESIKTLGAVIKSKKEELVISMALVFILLLIASSFMYFVENEAQPEAFSSIPETMWWGVATLTTVGYGDVYPITVAGRVLGGVIAILGIGMFALPTGILASGFAEAIQRPREKKRACPHCGADASID